MRPHCSCVRLSLRKFLSSYRYLLEFLQPRNFSQRNEKPNRLSLRRSRRFRLERELQIEPAEAYLAITSVSQISFADLHSRSSPALKLTADGNQLASADSFGMRAAIGSEIGRPEIEIMIVRLQEDLSKATGICHHLKRAQPLCCS